MALVYCWTCDEPMEIHGFWNGLKLKHYCEVCIKKEIELLTKKNK